MIKVKFELQSWANQSIWKASHEMNQTYIMTERNMLHSSKLTVMIDIKYIKIKAKPALQYYIIRSWLAKSPLQIHSIFYSKI